MPDFVFPPKYFPQVIAVKALIKYQDKYLIIKEDPTASWKPGRFGLPGGKIDPGEDWVTALARELKEEIGIEATPVGLVSIEEIVYHNPKLDLDQLTHHFLFQCAITASTFAQVSLRPNVSWYSLTELAQLNVSVMTEFYFTTLWSYLSDPEFTLVPLKAMRILNAIPLQTDKNNQAFQKWYSE